MRPHCLAYLCFLASLEMFLQAQVKQQFDIPRDPTRTTAVDVDSDRCFQSVLKNDRVRLYRVNIPPRQSSLLMVRKRDYLIVSLGKSNFEISGSGNSYPFQLDDAEMQVVNGGWSQKLVNLADGELRLLQLEVTQGIHPERATCGLAGPACASTRFGKTEDGEYAVSTLFETDTVKLARIRLGPGGALPTQQNTRPHILLALDAVRLYDPAGAELHLKTGEGQWFSGAGSRGLKNAEAQEIRLLMLELK